VSWFYYLSWLVLSFLSRFVPSSLGYLLARRIGDGAYFLLRNRRRIAAENYARVLAQPPDSKAVRRVTRAAFQNFACYAFDLMRFAHLSVPRIQERVVLHVEEHFEKALEKGKGAIFVTAHFGNMDWAGVVVAAQYGPITVPADFSLPRRLVELLIKHRAKRGARLVPYHRAPRQLLRTIRRGGLVAFLLDLGIAFEGGVQVDFFGAPAVFPAGPALLALRTGAPIIPGYAVVGPDKRIHAYSYPPIFLRPSGDKKRDVQSCLQQIARFFEDFIRRHPEQWYIFRPMWKSEKV